MKKLNPKIPTNHAYAVIVLSLLTVILVMWSLQVSQAVAEPNPVPKPQPKPPQAPVAIVVPTGRYNVPQAIKDAVASACATYGGTCARDMIALCLKESGCRLGKDVTNKNANSIDRGPWQLNSIHVEVKDPFDPVESANWTIRHMLANGWPKYRQYALGAHHSKTPSLNKLYGASVVAIANSL